ncbi:MAG: alanine dehydrogenase [Nitrospirae bacterium]|nr:alanine dehydrogenase [Nitrospirota bacterium]MBI3352209.1 alanine dehydrogenase [Nitrospirota bacterium]
MIIGVPKEIKIHEYRVAITPYGVRKLAESGHAVFIEKGAGEGSGFSDEEFSAAGAKLASKKDLFGQAELILKVKEPLPDEVSFFRKGQLLFTYLHLASSPALAHALIESHITGIAYETIQLSDGTLPLLIPMSEIAGRLSIQVGAFYLQKVYGGKGILLSGLAGVARGEVVILGAGTVGSNAARMAVGLGANVTVLDQQTDPLRRLDQEFKESIHTLFSYPEIVKEQVIKADLLIGAALIPGARAPFLVSKALIGKMKKGSVVVDVSVDQGGCFETTRPTTHKDPVYEVGGVIHYAVTNMPGAVPRTSTLALTQATLPYLLSLAGKGLKKAIQEDKALFKGVNFSGGKVTHPAVAEALSCPYDPLIP